jgi:hypothetical protein
MFSGSRVYSSHLPSFSRRSFPSFNQRPRSYFSPHIARATIATVQVHLRSTGRSAAAAEIVNAAVTTAKQIALLIITLVSPLKIQKKSRFQRDFNLRMMKS